MTGDARYFMPTVPGGYHAVITDPPYGTKGIGPWDADIRKDVPFWRLVYASVRPGAPLLVFASARDVHRVTTAIEAAGFDICDQIVWRRNGTYAMGDRRIDVDIDRLRDHPRPKTKVVRNPHFPIASAKRPWLTESIERGYHLLADDTPITPEAAKYVGHGTRLRQGYEPIIFARRPVEGTFADNVLKYGTGTINKFRGEDGLTPSNVFDVIDVPKPSKAERNGNNHPTVKPVKLMVELILRYTMPGDTILDPFAGSGTTGVACKMVGRNFVGIEINRDYADYANKKIAATIAGEAAL